ncbi:MAG TPA: AAA family ATPase [Gaiellaceae bacterium]
MTAAHSWQPENLAERGTEPAPEATISGITCPGLLSIHYSEPEGLKTWLELILSLEQIRAGNHVVWIDFEMSPRSIHARLLDLGATEEELSRFLYLHPSESIRDKQIQADLVTLMATYTPSLAVVDAMPEALALHELDGNSNADVATFYSVVLAPFRTDYAAVDVIDHVTKDRETRGRWPIGAQYKLGGADLGLSVEVVKGFSRGQTGLARLHVRKDREGILSHPYACELELTSDADTGRITWTFKQAQHSDSESGDHWKPDYLMGKVFEYVKAQDEPPSRGAITQAIHGRRQYVIQAIDELLAEGTLEESPGPRGSRLINMFPIPGTFPEQSGMQNVGTVFPVPTTKGNGNAERREGGQDDIPF